MRLATVIPCEGLLLRIFAKDGREGLFDLEPFLDSEAFAPLRDPREFKKVRNGGYFVEWECGADLSSDTILARMKEVVPACRENP